MSEITRLRVVKFLFWLIWLGLLGYGFSLQVLGEKRYKRLAKRVHQEKIVFPPQRGLIFDDRGRILALNFSCSSIYALPQYLTNKEKAAQILSKYKIVPYKRVLDRLRNRKSFFWIAKKIDYRIAQELKKELEKYRLSNAIVVVEDTKRFYPWRSFSTLLGFVGEDDHGLSGLEYRLDSLLSGEPGWAVLERDALGKGFHYPSYPSIPPKSGADVYLTLDADIQNITYEKVKRFVDSLGCKKGMGIVLDVPTGKIKALVSYPDFDPLHYTDYPPRLWRNYPIEDEYEPGSCFKHVIAATCLEHHLFDTSKVFNTGRGYIRIGGHNITDAHRLPDLSFSGIIVHSSNVGVSLLSLKVKPEWFYETIRRLGFGERTGVALPGEARGKIDKPDKLTRLRLANMAFGQGLTVTALQLAASYLAIANNGRYLRPYIIERIEKDKRVIYKGRPLSIRRALSDSTCRILKEILSEVVKRGTGRNAALNGIEVCGKTGTAQKPVEGGYSQEKVIASFVGFFPKDDPSLLIYVVLDEPKSPYYASQIACPLFREIAEEIIKIPQYAIARAGG